MALTKTPTVARIPQATGGLRHEELALQPRKRPRRSEHVSGDWSRVGCFFLHDSTPAGWLDVGPADLCGRTPSKVRPSGLHESGLARASPDSVLERGLILTMQDLSVPAVTWKESMALQLRIKISMDQDSESIRDVAAAERGGDEIRTISKHGGSEVVGDLFRATFVLLGSPGYDALSYLWMMCYTMRRIYIFRYR